MMTKLKYLFLSVLLVLNGCSSDHSSIFGASKIPEEFKLKCEKNKLLDSVEVNGVVYYSYLGKESKKEKIKIKDKEIEEDYSKRTKNAKHFKVGETESELIFIMKSYVGNGEFIKQNNIWYEVEHNVTTTKEYFKEQTKVSLLSRILGMKTSASTDTIYAISGDGGVGWVPPVAIGWNTVHDKTDGNNVFSVNIRPISASTNSASRRHIYRGYLPIDTSSLPDNATITSASVYLAQQYDNVHLLGSDALMYFAFVQTDQPSPTALTNADFNNCGATDNPTKGSADFTLKDITDTLNQYVEFPLNETGIGWISLDGYTMLGLRIGYDIEDVDPLVNGTQGQILFYNSASAGTTYDPYISITYTVPSGGVDESQSI